MKKQLEALGRNCVRNLEKNGTKVKNCMKTSFNMVGMKMKEKAGDIRMTYQSEVP